MYRPSHFILIIACILFSNSLVAQSIDRNTINAEGSSVSTGSLNVSYSIGETVVGTETGTIILTQGFQQPTFMVDEEPPPALGLENITSQIEVYPNPASDFVNFRNGDMNIEKMEITIYNLSGQIQDLALIQDEEIKIDIRTLVPGEYFIRLEGPNQYALFKLLKIN